MLMSAHIVSESTNCSRRSHSLDSISKSPGRVLGRALLATRFLRTCIDCEYLFWRDEVSGLILLLKVNSRFQERELAL